MILIEFELKLFVLYFFRVIRKQFAGDDTLPFQEDFSVYFFLYRKLEHPKALHPDI